MLESGRGLLLSVNCPGFGGSIELYRHTLGSVGPSLLWARILSAVIGGLCQLISWWTLETSLQELVLEALFQTCLTTIESRKALDKCPSSRISVRVKIQAVSQEGKGYVRRYVVVTILPHIHAAIHPLIHFVTNLFRALTASKVWKYIYATRSLWALGLPNLE